MKLITHLLLLCLLGLAGCGVADDPTREIDFVPLRSIEIISQNTQAAAGTANRFTAIGHYGDSSTFQFTRDITSKVTWTSSDPTVLTFSADPTAAGFATTGSAGTAQVTATLATVTAGLSFVVSNATITSLAIPPPASATLAIGVTLQLQATGTFSDGSVQDLTEVVAWSSSNLTVATVASTVPGSGLVKALGEGTSDIKASFGNQSATQTITVSAVKLASLTVTSAAGTSTLAMGTTMQLIATGIYTDGTSKTLTSQVLWSSDKTTVASIDQASGTTGILHALGAGSTTVTASLGGITSKGVQVTVTSATLTALAISPATPSVAVGLTLQLTANGNFSDGSNQDVTRDVVWSSGNASIATVSRSTGVEGTVTGVAPGVVTISANSSNIPTSAGAAKIATDQVTVQ